MSTRLGNKMLSCSNIFILLTLLFWHDKYVAPSVPTLYHIANALTLNSYKYISFISIILSSYIIFQMYIYIYASQEDIILEPPASLQPGFTILYNFVL